MGRSSSSGLDFPRGSRRSRSPGCGWGTARVDLQFTSNDGVTAVQVPRKEGELEVLIRQ